MQRDAAVQSHTAAEMLQSTQASLRQTKRNLSEAHTALKRVNETLRVVQAENQALQGQVQAANERAARAKHSKKQMHDAIEAERMAAASKAEADAEEYSENMRSVQEKYSMRIKELETRVNVLLHAIEITDPAPARRADYFGIAYGLLQDSKDVWYLETDEDILQWLRDRPETRKAAAVHSDAFTQAVAAFLLARRKAHQILLKSLSELKSIVFDTKMLKQYLKENKLTRETFYKALATLSSVPEELKSFAREELFWG